MSRTSSPKQPSPLSRPGQYCPRASVKMDMSDRTNGYVTASPCKGIPTNQAAVQRCSRGVRPPHSKPPGLENHGRSSWPAPFVMHRDLPRYPKPWAQAVPGRARRSGQELECCRCAESAGRVVITASEPCGEIHAAGFGTLERTHWRQARGASLRAQRSVTQRVQKSRRLISITLRLPTLHSCI